MNFRLPSNEAIVAAILERYWDKIINGCAYRFAQSYCLPPEDREELIQQASYELTRVDWRKKFRKNGKYVRETYPNHPPTWTAVELSNFHNPYILTIVKNSCLAVIHKQRCQGQKRSRRHLLSDIRPHVPLDDLEIGVDGQESRTMAKQIAEKARFLLNEAEWEVVSLMFGFDGGDDRSVIEISKEIRQTRKAVQQLLDSALMKVRSAIA